jgi:hypothetical protein
MLNVEAPIWRFRGSKLPLATGIHGQRKNLRTIHEKQNCKSFEAVNVVKLFFFVPDAAAK